MSLFLTLNVAVNIADRWFLPFQQYPFLREEMAEVVPHATRSGFKLVDHGGFHPHYVVLRDGLEFYLPIEAGTITDKKVPVEYVDRHRFWHSLGDDKIRDYVKAAKDYLNIEITYGPDYAGWYRRLREGSESRREKDNVGDVLPKGIE